MGSAFQRGWSKGRAASGRCGQGERSSDPSPGQPMRGERFASRGLFLRGQPAKAPRFGTSRNQPLLLGPMCA